MRPLFVCVFVCLTITVKLNDICCRYCGSFGYWFMLLDTMQITFDRSKFKVTEGKQELSNYCEWDDQSWLKS